MILPMIFSAYFSTDWIVGREYDLTLRPLLVDNFVEVSSACYPLAIVTRETPMPGTCLSAWTSCRDGKCRWSNDIVIVIDQATGIIVEVRDEERRIADRLRR